MTLGRLQMLDFVTKTEQQLQELSGVLYLSSGLFHHLQLLVFVPTHLSLPSVVSGQDYVEPLTN